MSDLPKSSSVSLTEDQEIQMIAEFVSKGILSKLLAGINNEDNDENNYQTDFVQIQ